MSQDQESAITKGFVVGSNRGGKEWVVRVKDDSSPINGRKLVVDSVRVGTKLAPGQDVSFIAEISAGLATYVEVLPKVRVAPKTIQEDRIGIAARQQPSGDIYLALSPVFDRISDQRDMIDAGGDEVVVDFLSFISDEGGAVSVIKSLSAMDGCFCETLEALLTEVFRLGQRHPVKPKP